MIEPLTVGELIELIAALLIKEGPDALHYPICVPKDSEGLKTADSLAVVMVPTKHGGLAKAIFIAREDDCLAMRGVQDRAAGAIEKAARK